MRKNSEEFLVTDKHLLRSNQKLNKTGNGSSIKDVYVRSMNKDSMRKVLIETLIGLGLSPICRSMIDVLEITEVKNVIKISLLIEDLTPMIERRWLEYMSVMSKEWESMTKEWESMTKEWESIVMKTKELEIYNLEEKLK